MREKQYKWQENAINSCIIYDPLWLYVQKNEVRYEEFNKIDEEYI